jgi:hypothetical protein
MCAHASFPGGVQAKAHWEGVVEQLQLKPFQLHELVRLYQEYRARLVPAHRRRTLALQRLQQVGGHGGCAAFACGEPRPGLEGPGGILVFSRLLGFSCALTRWACLAPTRLCMGATRIESSSHGQLPGSWAQMHT